MIEIGTTITSASTTFPVVRSILRVIPETKSRALDSTNDSSD